MLSTSQHLVKQACAHWTGKMIMIGSIRRNATHNALGTLLLLLPSFLAHTCLSFHSTSRNFNNIIYLTSSRQRSIIHISPSSLATVKHSFFSQRRPSTSSSSSCLSSLSSPSVEVYNNVISNETCRHLHNLSLEHTRRSHDGSSLFYRGRANMGMGARRQRKLTPIETTIDNILTALNDTSPMVEYWSRSSYINMDAHADIDENTLKEEGVLRCPRNGHVLYMQIANSDNENVGDDNSNGNDEQKNTCRMGPTVVFPSKKVAWGSVTPRTIPSSSAASYNSKANLDARVQEYIVDVENYWDEEQRLQYGYGKDDESCSDGEEMAIVPALNGRLLRFDGAAFHSVPKPPERYLLSGAELAAFLEKEEEDCEDEDDGYWDDDFDEYDDENKEEEDGSANPNQRSVLLFNTWPEGSSGPRGVLPDKIADAIPDGIMIEEEDKNNDECPNSSREDEQWQQWQNACGNEFEKVWCNPYEEWVSETIVIQQLQLNTDEGDCRNVTIPLMGNPTRRGVSETQDVMEGNVESDSFLDGWKVSLVTLTKG